MRILVTGGYGFIGLALVETLLKEDHQITIIDDLSTSNPSNPISNVTHFNIAADNKNCETIFKDNNFDIVIHLASKKLLNVNVEEYLNILQGNNKGLINILYLSEKYNVDKFITISNYNVYGKQDIFPITEEHELNPIDEQGFDDIIKELHCDQYRRRGLNTVILRIGEVYGPRMNNPNSFIRKLLTLNDLDTELKINNSILDYIYIGDLVEAIKNVCLRDTNHVLNISTNEGTTQKEILELFSNINDRYKNIVVKENSNLDPKYILDNTRAKSDLDWSPKYDLREGIEKTIYWHENNENISDDLPQEKDPVEKNIIKKLFEFDERYKYIENILLFSVFAILNYVLRYKLNMKIDLLILYIIFINMIYGFKQGSLAVVLSIITNIGFKFIFEDMEILNQINDPSNILYNTMYFIIGVSIGNKVDSIKIEKEILNKDLEDIKEDMNFTYEVYDKSIEIKNTLQDIIENYDDSFQKTLEIIERLEKSSEDNILNEARKLLIKTLKIEDIYIYSISPDREGIKLVSSPEIINFNSWMRIDENQFLKTIILEKKIYINRKLEIMVPTIAAPLFKDNDVIAVIFIDNIEFQRLNNQLLIMLKVLIYLISNRLSGTREYMKILNNAEIKRKE